MPKTPELLIGKRIAVFDAEIKNPIEECSDGWNSHDEMGISVLVIFDYQSMRYRVFDDSNKDEALRILHNYDLVVGFNTVNFDWKLINACWPSPHLKESSDYDILREIWISLGLNPAVFNPRTHGGYKLDDVAFETIGMRKTGDGAHAPTLYQEKRWAELVDYCIEDVRIERTLFESIVKVATVRRRGRIIPLRAIEEFPPFTFKQSEPQTNPSAAPQQPRA